jgi:hypothetical protein
VRLNLHWGTHGFDLFNSLNFTNSSTAGLPSGVSMNRLDAEMGFINYRNFAGFGTRGSGPYFGIRGVSRAGLGIGVVWLDGGAPTQPHSPMFQFRPISDGDHITMGWGPVELGFRFFESNTAITLGSGAHVMGCSGAHCNESDWIPGSSLRGPVFSLRYYINRPDVPDRPPAHLDDQEFAFRLTDMNMSRFASFYRGQSINNIIQTMGVLQGWPLGHDASQSQYGTALTGIGLNAIYNGAVAGMDASDLEDLLRRGNGLHRGISLGFEGAWLLASGIGWGTRGSYPTPDALAHGDRGAFDSPAGNSFRMMFPRQVATDGLALLGWSGALGRNGPTADGQTIWFHTANGILALGGLMMVLFARPISGNGTPPSASVPGRPQSLLPNSILGDYGGTFEGARTYDLYANNFYDSKQNEVIVTELGSALVSYSINRWLRPRPAAVDASSTPTTTGSRSRRTTADSTPRLNVSFSGSTSGFMLRLGGDL